MVSQLYIIVLFSVSVFKQCNQSQADCNVSIYIKKRLWMSLPPHSVTSFVQLPHSLVVLKYSPERALLKRERKLALEHAHSQAHGPKPFLTSRSNLCVDLFGSGGKAPLGKTVETPLPACCGSPSASSSSSAQLQSKFGHAALTCSLNVNALSGRLETWKRHFGPRV